MDPGKQNPIVKTVVVIPKTLPEYMKLLPMTRGREPTLQPSHVFRQGFDLKDWHKLPLARRLGIPLRFKKWGERATDPQVNVFAETMVIDPDFDCLNDIDIASTGFKPTVPEALYGSIEVVRDDEKDLYWQDIEALWEYVEQSFPHMALLSSTQPERDRSQVQITRASWEHGGNEESFIMWWRSWNANKRNADGSDYMYKSLECPVVGAGSKCTLG